MALVLYVILKYCLEKKNVFSFLCEFVVINVNSSSIQARLSSFGVPLHDARISLTTLLSICLTETSTQAKSSEIWVF